MENVTLGEGLMHFAVIFWKLLFALVPPVHWGGAWPAFTLDLCFIGWVVVLVSQCAS